MIELRTINEGNYMDCLNLKATVEKEQFVDSVVYSLKERVWEQGWQSSALTACKENTTRTEFRLR